MNEQIINKLINNIKETNLNKSSHWKKYFPDGSDYLNQFEHLEFDAFTKTTVKNLIRNILAKIIYGNEVFKTKTYYSYKSVFDKVGNF